MSKPRLGSVAHRGMQVRQENFSGRRVGTNLQIRSPGALLPAEPPTAAGAGSALRDRFGGVQQEGLGLGPKELQITTQKFLPRFQRSACCVASVAGPGRLGPSTLGRVIELSFIRQDQRHQSLEQMNQACHRTQFLNSL